MAFRTRVFVIILSLGVLIFVINLVRTRKLREEFALLWLLTGVALVLAPLSVDWLDRLSYALGFDYPPALIFLLAIICLLFICFQFSVNISRLADQNRVLIKDLAILSKRVQDLEGRIRGEEDGPRERQMER